MAVRFQQSLAKIRACEWDALNETKNPFIQHAFLETLENCGAASPENGWEPHHLALYCGEKLYGAVPLYQKTNSWGEFVFDWSWAHAAETAGLRYYPKLLSAVPFTPATGPRLLADNDETKAHLIRALLDEAATSEFSGLHLNFLTVDDARLLTDAGFILREDIQFHWSNRGYTDFNDFLESLTHKRRKSVVQERRRVQKQDIRFNWLAGNEATDTDWRLIHTCYENTFLNRGNMPVLSEACFRTLGQTLGSNVLLIIAYRNHTPLAGAFFMRGADTLFGRYWGATEHIPGLHFETCYYQGIEYCIQHKLKTVEPGAQGEHKMWRGFLPTVTRSCHWLKDQRLHRAVSDALQHERAVIGMYRHELEEHSPYRAGSEKYQASGNCGR